MRSGLFLSVAGGRVRDVAEALKEKINRESVGVLADGVGSVCAEFSRERFVREAVSGLEPLELKDRIRHVAGALHASLPLEFPAASGVLREASGKVRFDMWSGWPATEYVGFTGSRIWTKAWGRSPC